MLANHFLGAVHPLEDIRPPVPQGERPGPHLQHPLGVLEPCAGFFLPFLLACPAPQSGTYGIGHRKFVDEKTFAAHQVEIVLGVIVATHALAFGDADGFKIVGVRFTVKIFDKDFQRSGFLDQCFLRVAPQCRIPVHHCDILDRCHEWQAKFERQTGRRP